MALTARQKEIKGLLDQGKTPKEVGQQLGISENAVYQQRRRIKAAGGTTGRKQTTRKATATKQSARKQTTRQRPARAQRPALSVVNPTAAPVPADPLAAVRERKAAIGLSLNEAKAELENAAKAHEAAQKAYAEAEGKVKPELERLDAVEALLTGKLKPPKSKPKATVQEAPAPEPEPTPTPAATDEPTGSTTEAAAQDQAAEAPDEPTEVQPSGNGAGEERPGVPTLPEFSQEDAFAS